MGFDDLVDCSSFVSSAIGQMGHSASAVSHAMGELSKAMGTYSHAYGYDSMSCKQTIKLSAIVKMSIVRKSSLPERQTTKNATLTVDNAKINWDILEKNFGPFNKGDVIFHR